MYTSLNDAIVTNQMLTTGDVKIWYYKDELSRDISFGYNAFLEYSEKRIDLKNLAATHALIGSIKGPGMEIDVIVGLDGIFCAMQGESWSPNGEARDLIKSKNLGHTSMTVGDIIEVGEDIYFVDSHGFTKLN